MVARRVRRHGQPAAPAASPATASAPTSAGTAPRRSRCCCAPSTARRPTARRRQAEIDRDGCYVSALYTFAKQFQLGVRYEEYDQNTDVANDKLSIITAGFHYMIKGKNINLKAEWCGIEQEGRKVNNVLDEKYNQFVIAAQIAF